MATKKRSASASVEASGHRPNFTPKSAVGDSGVRHILSSVTSATNDERLGEGDHFTFAGVQVNADLAAVAACELDLRLEFGAEEPNGVDMLRAPMYWKLREAFVDAAIKGDTQAFACAIWRAYCAGRMSPDRLVAPEKVPVRPVSSSMLIQSRTR